MSQTKTLDDLAKQVIDSQAGLMSVDDLKVFFEETPQAPVSTSQTPVEPVIAPAPQASTATPVVTTEPVVSQPDIREFMPEKFRDADAKTSIEKLAKSYAELEIELKKEREERSNIDRMLQSFTAPPPDMATTPTPGVPEPAGEEVDDATFFDKPTEASKKVASQVAGAMLMAYHTALTEATRRTQYVDAFKAAHPDFNEYKEDMAVVLRSRPDLDKKVESLPFVYETAKTRYRARLDKMRKELGVQPESTPTPTPTVPQSVMTEADLIEKAKAAILAEISRRRAATGITGGVPPTTPATRMQPGVTQVPLTPAERLFEEMRASGPKKLDLSS